MEERQNDGEMIERQNDGEMMETKIEEIQKF